MGTKIGELRETLVTAIEELKAGRMEVGKAKAMAALAQQVHASLQVELDARRLSILMQNKLDAIEMEKIEDIGSMQIGFEESGKK